LEERRFIGSAPKKNERNLPTYKKFSPLRRPVEQTRSWIAVAEQVMLRAR
jgi:hypothetical protein